MNAETAQYPAAIDGSTVYVMPLPHGLGATLDMAVSIGGDKVRHVVVCGERPGAGKTGVAAWANERGEWFQTASPHVTRSSLRANLARDGHRVQVSRIETWFGSVLPGDAAEAMRIIRHVTSAVGVRPVGTPGQTGRLMLRAVWDRQGASWPAPPPEVASLLRETSGQGRFQLFEPARAGGAELVGVDARFQYAAIAGLELPVGEPVELAGEPDEYAPSWCHVEFTPNGGAVGLLGVNGLGGWWWPTDGGPHRTWCSGAEVHAARRAGYRVAVLRAIVWPGKARPLAAWANMIDRERERLATLPVAPGVRAAARAGLRSMLVQSIGAMHGRITAAASPVPSASADETGGAAAFVHPEWTTAIWATARARLARVMLDQAAPVVACALDGFYTAGEPIVPPDDGRSGRWREVWRCESWPALRTMADLYELRGEQ